MADQFLVNQTPATAPIGVFNMKTTGKLATWTVPQSSDGTTYNSSGDQISSGASGANGMANNSAWYVLKWPGSGAKSICLQRGTTDLVWRVKVSLTNGFVGGSPGATRVPSATDEKTLIGGGTDASPTFANLFNGIANGGFRHEVWFQGAAPWGMYSTAFATGGAAPGHGIFLDHMNSASFQSGETDPYVWYASGGAASMTTDLVGGVNAALSVGAGVLGGSGGMKAVAPAGLGPGSGGQSGIAPNPFSGKDDGAPLMWFSTVAPTLFKGWSDLFFHELTGTPAATRTTPFALDFSGTRTKCLFGNLILPWDGSTPTV
jgi:hypothetical protein